MTPVQTERYARHLMLKEIGGPGQAKLRAGHVTIVGAGALGGPCALYLAAAGIGRITLVDDDTVALSNLQRQIQFGTGDIAGSKVETLARRLNELNPDTVVESQSERVTADMALPGDLIVDASDNFPTRFALNAHAHTTARALVSGAVGRWDGQVGVFASGIDTSAPCYQCFVPDTPPNAETCAEVGVVGALTGLVGSAMALEVIKLLTGAGAPLIGRLWIVNGLTAENRTVTLRKHVDCPVCVAKSPLGDR